MIKELELELFFKRNINNIEKKIEFNIIFKSSKWLNFESSKIC